MTSSDTRTAAAAVAPPGKGEMRLEVAILPVSDVDQRFNLIARGVDISEGFHGQGFRGGTAGRVSGPDPERESYSSFASFSDPDGNEWLLQQIRQRLPGR